MPRKIILNIIILLFISTLLLTGCESITQKNFREKTVVSSDNNIKSKLAKYMDRYSKKNEFSGSILIAKDDEVLLNKGYGIADYNKRLPNKPQTIFEIASLTKQFTATAILMLQEQKLLNVNDSLSTYISDYPNGDDITIYNLLTHTSGIPDYLDYADSIDTENHNLVYTPEELIKLFKNEPFNFNAGTSFEYSNSNYILLGYIIEKASNITYEDYIENNIIVPLNLTSTGFLSNETDVKNKSIGYYFINKHSNEHAEAPKMEGLMSYSAGEIYSTSEDLLKWENALFSEELITKESLNEMFTPYLNNYGYGWFTYENEDEDKIVFHSGNLPGYTSFVEKNLDKNYLIIILCNENIDETINNLSTELSEILDREYLLDNE
ncbi:penicillin-binding protein 4* [Clostridium puniceum]|uniref:Penicillin-binding protein 4 n=1 Tax=Clostridium puniceum TaxID=29367 RepID=A0A1S8TSG9_9CLOT|nr:serine hydrolase domain-containing protein [Clostridium puniceum]OOM80656.1 penicillin-binding protein 4* [Clostridium puniceum]